MADRYLTLQTTSAGMNMIIKSLYGGSITFTRMVAGNGKPKNLNNPTSLINPMLEIGITKADVKSDYLLLTGYANSSSIKSSFYGYELGVYAKDADNNEQLYAYRYSSGDVDYFPASDSGRTLELTMTVVVQLGNAENVKAILVEGDAYALKSDFEAHLSDKFNPHGVTAAQVGAAASNHTHGTADIMSGILSEARGGTGSDTLYGSDLAKVRKATLLPSAWSSSAPYTQSLPVSGITANHAPIISCGAPSVLTAAKYTDLIKAYGMIDRAVTGTNKITFYCYRKKPTIEIPVYIKGV